MRTALLKNQHLARQRHCTWLRLNVGNCSRGHYNIHYSQFGNEVRHRCGSNGRSLGVFPLRGNRPGSTVYKGRGTSVGRQFPLMHGRHVDGSTYAPRNAIVHLSTIHQARKCQRNTIYLSSQFGLARYANRFL
jgi:hypothetical protein